ncbi:response regulator transcription factor [Sedimenticola sp.]|uniref:response regulator transcription factor n=1 Tax=Sedimenticola sp. TaxID=1940285 RepID=UPI0025899F85|nr:response regulator transcription factor [Sedimenticola sp.]MCW8905202.1 response regulator transcription factor [Sedimenticola sp.]
MPKFLVADDHPLFREALRQVIEEYFEDVEIIEVSTLDEAVQRASEDFDLDLILLDLRMPGSEGFSGLVSIRNAAPTIPVAIVSASEDPDAIRRGLTCGAFGFITKSSPKARIAEAIETVLAGGTYVPDELENAQLTTGPRSTLDHEFQKKFALLTPAELSVLQHLTEGKPNKIIACELDIKESTVKAHISSVLRKLGVNSRTQAVLAAQKLGNVE